VLLPLLATSSLGQGGLFDLGTFGGVAASAADVSADGAVVVGRAFQATGVVSAFYWTPVAGMQVVPVGLDTAEALLVSADGPYVVGTARFFQAVEAFRWSAASGLERLGSASGSTGSSPGTTMPRDISDDGGVIVGWNVATSSQERAFRWTAAGGPEDLGTRNGRASRRVDRCMPRSRSPETCKTSAPRTWPRS